MGAPATLQPTTAIEDIGPLRQLRALTSWVGDGRALTQTGRLRLADARELVALLGTGDELDPMDGRFRTKSSAELPELTLIVEWAKACRLVRVAKGRLVTVKRSASLLDRPHELWNRMFEVFPQLGEALCPDGWAQSLMRRHFREAVDAVLLLAYRGRGRVALADARALAWEIVTAPYVLDGATEQQQSTWRAMNDRDLRYALQTLERLGAVGHDGDVLTLTEQGLAAMRRVAGEPEPGDPVLQLRIRLLGVTKPPVWRRLLVAADIRLDRLHDVIQAAMGWENYHMHVFSAAGCEYGLPDPELGFRDERKTTLNGVIAEAGDRLRYTYDFGDDWEHEIVVEKVHRAESGARYPICVAGKGRCPPEDCGGVWGYASLRETLADPNDDEHADMLEWLAFEAASEFDPADFDVAEVNAVL